jgi:hypothetical protein
MTTIAWFSAGVSSAVATKLEIDNIDRIIYTHIDDQHPDTLRFISDCAEWFGKPIEVIQSKYKSVENACLSSGGRGYINGPAGAACTKFLKRGLRIEWEKAHETEPLKYMWGLDAGEKHRCLRIEKTMPMQEHFFPLVDRGLTKPEVHKILAASGIKRPAMYDLGYHNNNCVGCVKGGMGYWNHIRVDFPEVFEARAKMERKIKATCIKGVYLDELDPERGRHESPIVDDCGILCEVIGL